MKYQSSNSKRIYDISFESRKYRLLCPECSPSRKKLKEKDLEYYPDTNRAFCFHCNTTFYEHKPYITEKTFEKPEWKNKTDLSDKSVKYFQGRMISQATLIEMKIYSDNEYMPQFKDKKSVEVMCFPYFRKGSLVNIKFRGPEKSFKMVSNAELIWYNFDCIELNTEIIICEGEIDALTFIENGYKNVISVPNGASNKNADYLDSSIDLFNHITKIYLATDVDSKGIELKDELIRRFGAERCMSVSFLDCKDANEYFCKYGGFEFKKCIDNAVAIPIAGNIEISSFYSDIIDLYENGLKPGAGVGIDEIDKYCTWELGRLCTVSGIPSSGKSEFVDFLISKLNLLYGWKAAYFTPENYPLKYHYAKIHEKFSGYKFKKETDRSDFDTIYEYITDNFFYILNEEDLSVESVIKSAKSFVKQKGIKILVIDPYNKLDHQLNRNENETQYVSRILDVLINFARINSVLIFLIAHPKKIEKGTVPTMYDISGSAHFYNKTDYGFVVHRLRDDNGAMNNSVEVHWQKIKFKHLGTQGVSELDYNLVNGRFDPVGVYDNTDWLQSSPVQVDSDFWDQIQNNYNLKSTSTIKPYYEKEDTDEPF